MPMQRLIQRSNADGVRHHLMNPVRVYSEDSLQITRIWKSREIVRKAMNAARLHPMTWPPAEPLKIVEVGCGTADISGFIAKENPHWHATGIECHTGALLEASLRYGDYFTGIPAPIQPIGEGPSVSVVILCEVLEHLEDPLAVAASWLKRARASVISHPLDEPMGSQLSGGDHCWSLSRQDHVGFFEAGGHVLDETEEFDLGAYRIILSRGHRKE